MSDQLPSVIGCGLLATDEGLTLRGLGSVNDNDNAVLTRLDFRSLSLRRNEQCWFHIPASYRGQQVWMVGIAFTGVKDFVNRDGMAGAFAVITEGAFARDGYAEGVFLARALVRAMHDRMIDKATMRVHISPAAEVLQLAGRDLTRAPKDPAVNVDMEGTAIEVSVARNWTAEITPDALMLMVRNQRETFEPLLSAGYVLRENIGDRTQWAIDADFYKRFYYREIFQKHKTLIESNSQLQEAVGKEQVRFSKLKSDYDKQNDEVNTLNRRVVTLNMSLNSAERDKGDLQNRTKELEKNLGMLQSRWHALVAEAESHKLEAESLKHENDALQQDAVKRSQTTPKDVEALKANIKELLDQNKAMKGELGKWDEWEKVYTENYEAQIESLKVAAAAKADDVDSGNPLTPQLREHPLQRFFAIGVIIIAAIVVMYFWVAFIRSESLFAKQWNSGWVGGRHGDDDQGSERSHRGA